MKELLVLTAFLVIGSCSTGFAEENHPPHKKNKKQTEVKHEDEEPEGEHEHDHGKGNEQEAEHEHEHGNEKAAESGKEEKHHDEHGEEEGHGHGEEEENAQVGPTKGILEADAENGFKLSPEAEKNFGLIRVSVVATPIEIPRDAIVTAGAERNLFRYRNGFYKRIDFDEINKQQNKILVQSKDLKRGDEIVVQGLGFLRLAEIAAYGGAPEGHSH